MKNTVINRKNNDEHCFRWAVIAVLLHHKEIAKDIQRISMLEIPKSMQLASTWVFINNTKIDKFEEKNTGIAVNMLFNTKQGIYPAHRSEFNRKCSKQVNLLMNGNMKVKMPSDKEKWLKFHNGQCQVKVPLILYGVYTYTVLYIESILKLVDEQYREKMNKMTTEQKCKTPYTEKINIHLRSEWCIQARLFM